MLLHPTTAPTLTLATVPRQFVAGLAHALVVTLIVATPTSEAQTGVGSTLVNV